MLENLKKYQIKNLDSVSGGNIHVHNPECYDN